MSYPYYGMILGSVLSPVRGDPAAYRRIAAARSGRASARGDRAMITFLLTSLLGVMLIGIPILLVDRADRVRRHGDAARSRDAAVRAENVRAARLVHAAGDALFHPCGLDHDGGRHQPAACRFRARVGRPFPRRARACLDRRQHGDVRRLRLVDRRRFGDRIDHHPGDETDRLQARLRRGIDRDCRNDGRDHPTEHDDGRLRRDRAGLDRRAVPRRHHPRHPDRPRIDGDREALHLSPEVSGASRGDGALRPVRAVALGAARRGPACSRR